MRLNGAHYHLTNDTYRALRGDLVDGTPSSDATLELRAELDAWAPEEGIDKPTAEEYLLRLREREVRAELRNAGIERAKELSEALVHIQDAIANLERQTATPG